MNVRRGLRYRGRFDYVVPAKGLTRILHTLRETRADCSRRREGAERPRWRTGPPPHVGGYGTCEISGLFAAHGRQPFLRHGADFFRPSLLGNLGD